MTDVEKKNLGPFGNLSFSEYTPDTEAERVVLALQASMVMKGYSKKSKPMVCLVRLKKAMKKSKIRKYSFSLSPVVKENTEPVKVPEKKEEEAPLADTHDDTVVSSIAEVLGLRVAKSSSTVSGRTVTLSVSLCGTSFSGSSSSAQQRIRASLRSHSGVLGPVFVQPLRVVRKESLCAVRVTVVYKVL